VTIELEREDRERGDGLHFQFPDGSPLSRGALLALFPDGQPDHQCSRAIGADGKVFLPEICLTGLRRFLPLHSGALLTLLTTTELRTAATFEVPRHPGLPLRLRFQDGNGQPIVGRPLWIRLASPRLELGPEHLMAVRPYLGPSIPWHTDAQGNITVPFLDAAGNRIPFPEVALQEGAWHALPTGDLGGDFGHGGSQVIGVERPAALIP
jgi:hypothetical protein